LTDFEIKILKYPAPWGGDFYFFIPKWRRNKMSDILNEFKQHQLKHNPRTQPQPAIQPQPQQHGEHGFNSYAQQRANAKTLASSICQECLQIPCIR